MTTPLWLSRLRPEEQLLHERLFLAADTGREHCIGGAQAVAFFGRTGLPVATLKQVWTLAATATQRSLSRAEFSVALRLVALAQQGYDLSNPSVLEETDAKPLAMPRFAEDPVDTNSYGMTDTDEGRYSAIFDSMGADARGLVPRESAMELFARSGLSINELTELVLSVQTLQLQPDAALLHRHEFALVMHLIVCRTKRELQSLPLEFPKYLFPQLSQPSWMPGHTNTMQQPTSAAARESSFDLDDGFTATLRPPEKLLGVPALTDLLEHQNTNVAQLANLAERLISSEEEAHRNLERYLQDLVCQLQDLSIAIPPSLTGDITLTIVDELRTVIVQQIQSVDQDIAQMNRTASGRDRTTDSMMGAIPALIQELEALKLQSRQLEDRKRSLHTQLTMQAARSSISIAATSQTDRRSSRTGSKYDSLKINTQYGSPKPETPGDSAAAFKFPSRSSQPQESFGTAFESPRLEVPARSLFSPTPGDGDEAAAFGSPSAAAWGDFDTTAAETIQSPSSAFGDFAGASSQSSAWSPRADGSSVFADEPKNAPSSPSLLVFSPTESGVQAGDKPSSSSNHFFGDDSMNTLTAATAVESDSSLLSLDSMMDFYPPKPKETVPVFDVFALAEASTFSALDAGNDIDVNVLEVVPEFAQSVQETATPAVAAPKECRLGSLEPPSAKAPGRAQSVEAARASLSSIQPQSPVASSSRPSTDSPSFDEPSMAASASSGAGFGNFDAFPASFDAAPADATTESGFSGDFAFPSFGESTQVSSDPAAEEWAANSFGDFSTASGDNATVEASTTGFGDFESAFDSSSAASDGFAATSSNNFGEFGAFEASDVDQAAPNSWGTFDAFESKDKMESPGNGFGSFGDLVNTEQAAVVVASEFSGEIDTNGSTVGIEKGQEQPSAFVADLSGGFGYFSDSRTASDAAKLPVFGDFDSSADKSATATDDQETFGAFSDSRTNSHSDIALANDMPAEQPAFGAFDSFPEQAAHSSSSLDFTAFTPATTDEMTPSDLNSTVVPLEHPNTNSGESSSNDFGSSGEFNVSSETVPPTVSFASFSDDTQASQPVISSQEESFVFSTASSSSPELSTGASSFGAFGEFGNDTATASSAAEADASHTIDASASESFGGVSQSPEAAAINVNATENAFDQALGVSEPEKSLEPVAFDAFGDSSATFTTQASTETAPDQPAEVPAFEPFPFETKREPAASIIDLSNDFGYFSDSRTASNVTPSFGDFAAFGDSLEATPVQGDTHKSFGFFSDSRSSSFKDSGAPDSAETIPQIEFKLPDTAIASANELLETPNLVSETLEISDAPYSFSASNEVTSNEDTFLAASLVQEPSRIVADVNSGPSAESAGGFGDFEFSSPSIPSMALEEQTDGSVQEPMLSTLSTTPLQNSNDDSTDYVSVTDVANTASVDEVTDSIETVETTSSGDVQLSHSETTESAAAVGSEPAVCTAKTSFDDFDASFTTNVAPRASIEHNEPASFGSFTAPTTAPAPTTADLDSVVEINASEVVTEASATESVDAFQDFTAPVDPATSEFILPGTSAADAFQDFSAPSEASYSAVFSMPESSVMDSFQAPVETAVSKSATDEVSSVDAFQDFSPANDAAPSEFTVSEASAMESFEAFSAPVETFSSESTVSEIPAVDSVQVSSEPVAVSMTEADQPTFNGSSNESDAQLATDEFSISNSVKETDSMTGQTSTEPADFKTTDSVQTFEAGIYPATEAESSSKDFVESDAFGSFESHVQASEQVAAAVNSGNEIASDFGSFNDFQPSIVATPELSEFESFESQVQASEQEAAVVNSGNEIAPDFESFDDFSHHSASSTAIKTEEFSFESGLSSGQMQTTELDSSSAEVASNSLGVDSAAQLDSFESVAKTDDFTDISEGYTIENAARSDGESDGNFVMVSDPGSSCEDVDAFADGTPPNEDCDFHAASVDDVEKASAELSEELEISSSSFSMGNAINESDPFSPSEHEPTDGTSTVVMNDDEFEQMLEMAPSAADNSLNKSAEDVAKDINDLLGDGEQSDAAADANKTYTMEEVDSELDAALSSEPSNTPVV